LSKVADIYWDSTPKPPATRRRTTPRRRTAAKPAAKVSTTPWWLLFVIFLSIFVMLGVSINYRAYLEAEEEAGVNTNLAARIQNLQDENLALQEEIHTLKTDPVVIAREARRVGMHLQQQVPVPVN